MENSISYLSALGLINCDYHLPAMENPVTSKLARNLVNDCHFGLIALDNPEAPRLNVEENGCINLSAYIDDIKIKKIKYLVCSVRTSKSTVHLFEESKPQKCPCLKARPTPSRLRLPPRKEIFVYREYSYTHLFHMIVSISNQHTNVYNVVIDFTEELLPRALPLRNLVAALSNTDDLIHAVYNSGLGIIGDTDKEESEDSNEYILTCTDPEFAQQFRDLGEWDFHKQRSIEKVSAYYTPKNGSNQRLVIRKGQLKSGTFWYCLVLFNKERVKEDLFVDIKSIVSQVKPKFKKEILLYHETCMHLLHAALVQGRILNQIAANVIESDDCASLESDKLAIIHGEWKIPQLHDGEDWKNNSSTVQRISISPNEPSKKVTTFVPRQHILPPTGISTNATHKLEHLCLGGFTYLYYHVQPKKTPDLQPATKKAKKAIE